MFPVRRVRKHPEDGEADVAIAGQIHAPKQPRIAQQQDTEAHAFAVVPAY